MPDIVRCDCRGNCFCQYPEVTQNTRRNHRNDDIILGIIQANPQSGRTQVPDLHSNPTRNSQQSSHVQHRTHSLDPRPHSTRRVTFQEPSTQPQPHSQAPVAIPTEQVHRTQNRMEPVLSAQTYSAIKLIESEIIALSQLPLASLATPLVFTHKPSENGVYDYKLQLHPIPNTGTYKLNSGVRTNSNFLGHETRVWELLGLAHFLPACPQKDRLEDGIWQEIDRLSKEKESHWNQQRLYVDIGKVVVNTGMMFSSCEFNTLI